MLSEPGTYVARAALASVLRARSYLVVRLGVREARRVREGLDSLTVRIGVFGVLLAVALGALAGHTAGVTAGILAALASLVPPAVLAVAMDRRSRNAARTRRRRELLEVFAPPRPTDDRRGEE
jgi:hypothetical protein